MLPKIKLPECFNNAVDSIARKGRKPQGGPAEEGPGQWPSHSAAQGASGALPEVRRRDAGAVQDPGVPHLLLAALRAVPVVRKEGAGSFREMEREERRDDV